MEEQIVTYKVAKLAKDKGFDELCMKLYSDKIFEDFKHTSFGNNKTHSNTKINIPKDAIDSDETIITAPTQTLLQKWLRIKHNIHIIIIPVIGSKNGYDSYPIIGWRADIITLNRNSKNSYYMGYPILDYYTAEESAFDDGDTLEDINIKRFDEPEEALEDALIDALNMLNYGN